MTMGTAATIELEEAGLVIPILFENRSILALDKPAGWMLAPDDWDETGRNLQLALLSSMNAGDFWARSRNLKFLRFVHRLDADTSGVILFAKSPGALRAYSELFEARRVEKYYLAVVSGVPKEARWVCRLPLAPDPRHKGRMKVVRNDAGKFKDAETRFMVLQSLRNKTLLEAQPMTGRTHQIRVHLAEAGHPVLEDPLYGTAKPPGPRSRPKLALRAGILSFPDPFEQKKVRIEAAPDAFLRDHGFDPAVLNSKAVSS
jgi:RluA family pseudouridine synthase